MRATLVLPWLDEELRDETLRSMCCEVRAITMPVHNRPGRSTVAGAWNLGRDRVLDGRRDWLILCSTTIHFGLPGGRDLLDGLERPEIAAHGVVSAIGGGWHLSAIRRDVLEIVGPFDTFARAYCEDSDFIIRHRLAGLGDLWEPGVQAHIPVEFTSLGDAHSMERGLASWDLPSQARSRYREKWGGNPSHETFETPFDRADVDWRWLWANERDARMALGCVSA